MAIGLGILSIQSGEGEGKDLEESRGGFIAGPGKGPRHFHPLSVARVQLHGHM